MKKTVMMALIALMVSANIYADDYTTAGDGTTWTMTKLSETDGSGVTKNGTTFTMTNKVVVSNGDKFEMEGGITVQMDKAVSLEIVGNAMMTPVERSKFTRLEEVVPGLVYLKGGDDIVSVQNIDFEYTGLKYFAEKGMDVKDCTFRYHEASSTNGSSALNIAGNGAVFTIRNCVFEKNSRAAIGGAANATNPTTIEDCEFWYNDQSNGNYPQLNLTASTSIIVRNNKVIGDRSKTRGGGIIVSDLLSVATNPQTIIEGNDVRDNRYGISLYSGQTAIIRNNILINNDTETNPMSGGSGISIYDPTTQSQETTITGNYIEGSLWGISIVGGKNISASYNTFYNNGNNGTIYDLYNNSSNTVYAQNNYWKTAATQDEAGIEDVIFHKNDDPTLGEVIFVPFLTEDPTSIINVKTIKDIDAIYSLSGIRQNDLQKGLNIVIKNGKPIKVIK